MHMLFYAESGGSNPISSAFDLLVLFSCFLLYSVGKGLGTGLGVELLAIFMQFSFWAIINIIFIVVYKKLRPHK